MWYPNSFYPSFAALLLNVFFIIYILKVGLNKPGNFPSFLLFLTIAVGVLGEILERIAGPPPNDEWLAFFGAELIAVSGVFLPSVLIHFGMDFPYRLRIKRVYRTAVLAVLYGLSVLGLGLVLANNALNGIMVGSVTPYPALGQQVWGMDYGAAYYFYLLASFFCGFALLAVLYSKMRRTKIKILKNQIEMVLIGLIVVYVLITFSVVIPALLHYTAYPLSSLSLTIFGIFVIYSIAKYHLFVVSPVQESGERLERKHKLEPGTVLIKPLKEAYSIFSDQVHGGLPGLLFTVEDIERVRSEYGFRKTPVFRVSEAPGKDTLNPRVSEHREMVPFIISEFLEQSSSGVVFLDRIDVRWDDSFVDFAALIIEFVREERRGILILAPHSDEVRQALMANLNRER